MKHGTARLNHIGIAVHDLPQLRKLFSILGMEVGHQEPVPEQGVNTHFLPLVTDPGQSHFEFLEPTDPEGTVARFMQKRGPGIHHLSFSVEKGRLDPLSRELVSTGFRLIYDQPRLGAQNMRVNFIHPAAAGGLLIEIMEPAS